MRSQWAYIRFMRAFKTRVMEVNKMTDLITGIIDKLWVGSSPWTKRIIVIVAGIVAIAGMYFGVIK